MDEGVLEQHAPARAVALDLEAEAERRLGWVVMPAAIAILSRTFSILVILAWNAIDPVGRANPLTTWDGAWYLRIVANGYHAEALLGGQDYAFFPLWAGLIKVGSLNGALPAEWVAVVLANVLFIAAAVAVWRALEQRLDGRTATGAVALLSFAPTAYVFSMAYAESLFLVLAATYFAVPATSRARPILAALAAVTRLQGLALVGSAALRALVARGQERRVLIVAVAFGLLAFGTWFLYVAVLTGNLMGWTTGSMAWVGGEASSVLVTQLRAYPVRVAGFSLFLLAIVVGTALLVRRSRELATYAALVLAICVLPIVAGGLLHNVPRYAMLAFPAFAGLSGRLGRRGTIVAVVVFAICQVAFLGWVVPVAGSQSP